MTDPAEPPGWAKAICILFAVAVGLLIFAALTGMDWTYPAVAALLLLSALLFGGLIDGARRRRG